HKQSSCCIIVIDTWDVDGRIVLEHLLKMLCVGCFRDVVYLFVDGAFELTIDGHQVDEFAGVYEAINHPDDELEGAQVHAYKLFDIGPLNLDGDLFSCRDKGRLMYLSQ